MFSIKLMLLSVAAVCWSGGLRSPNVSIAPKFLTQPFQLPYAILLLVPNYPPVFGYQHFCPSFCLELLLIIITAIFGPI
jgi:hypothetical protein